MNIIMELIILTIGFIHIIQGMMMNILQQIQIQTLNQNVKIYLKHLKKILILTV